MTTDEVTMTVETKWSWCFWRRLAAFFVDFALLGLLGFILGLFFENVFIQIGNWGRLIGFIIALSYFSVMNSNLFSGQTIGKKILKIKVVNSSNESISFEKSILRTLVLITPIFLNGIYFSEEKATSFIAYLLGFIFFGGGFSIIYLFLFNKITRQSLHDLVARTYVVNTKASSLKIEKIWNKHFIIILTILATALIASVLISKFTKNDFFTNLAKAQSAVSKEPNILNASVSSGFTTSNILSNKDKKTNTYLHVQATLKTKDIENILIAKKFALVAMDSIPDAKNMDSIQISLIKGYDIGIWSQWTSFRHNFKPSELR